MIGDNAAYSSWFVTNGLGIHARKSETTADAEGYSTDGLSRAVTW